jgi:transposase
MKGRKLGQCELNFEQMTKIVTLTEEGKFRSDIADEVGCSKMTVYLWQKKLC